MQPKYLLVALFHLYQIIRNFLPWHSFWDAAQNKTSEPLGASKHLLLVGAENVLTGYKPCRVGKPNLAPDT